MSPENDRQLRERYQLVFQGPLLNDEPIRCGDGWWGLLDGLCRQLQRLIEQEPEAERSQYTAAQVKEKFGTLRFYLMGDPTPQMAREIAGAEWASGLFCDVCGHPGSLRTNGLVRTRCDAHKDWRGEP